MEIQNFEKNLGENLKIWHFLPSNVDGDTVGQHVRILKKKIELLN